MDKKTKRMTTYRKFLKELKANYPDLFARTFNLNQIACMMVAFENDDCFTYQMKKVGQGFLFLYDYSKMFGMGAIKDLKTEPDLRYIG
jgi:hypothetical protein